VIANKWPILLLSPVQTYGVILRTDKEWKIAGRIGPAIWRNGAYTCRSKARYAEI